MEQRHTDTYARARYRFTITEAETHSMEYRWDEICSHAYSDFTGRS